MSDFNCISQAPSKDCLVLINTLSRTIVQKTLLFSKNFSTEHQPVQSLHPDVEAYFQLDLGCPLSKHPSVSCLNSLLLGEVGEGRLRQVSKLPLWWHWLSEIIRLGRGLPLICLNPEIGFMNLSYRVTM